MEISSVLKYLPVVSLKGVFLTNRWLGSKAKEMKDIWVEIKRLAIMVGMIGGGSLVLFVLITSLNTSLEEQREVASENIPERLAGVKYMSDEDRKKEAQIIREQQEYSHVQRGYYSTVESEDVLSVTPTKEVFKETTSINKDYLVNCNFPHSRTIKVTGDQCSAMTDCEVSADKWQAVWKSDCDALRAKEKREATTKTAKQNTDTVSAYKAVSCELSYGTYKLSSGSCEQAKKTDVSVKALKSTTWETKDKVSCVVGNYYYYVSQDLCDDFKESDAQLQADVNAQNEARFWDEVERSTGRYEECIEGAESMYTSTINVYIAGEYYLGYETDEAGVEKIKNEAIANYNRAKQKCDELYPPL